MMVRPWRQALRASGRPAEARGWLAGAALGAMLGALLLGIGGRVAMRGIALLEGQAPGFSAGGTATVVLLGGVAGLVGALVLGGLRLLLRKRRLVRGAVFWTFLMLVTLRGLRQVDAHRLLLFVPLVILYGITLQLLSCRVSLRSDRPHREPRPGPAATAQTASRPASGGA